MSDGKGTQRLHSKSRYRKNEHMNTVSGLVRTCWTLIWYFDCKTNKQKFYKIATLKWDFWGTTILLMYLEYKYIVSCVFCRNFVKQGINRLVLLLHYFIFLHQVMHWQCFMDHPEPLYPLMSSVKVNMTDCATRLYCLA